ncbi:MAG TPA: NAD(P)/FAD-dependent oxidoreductase [Candidatus Avacidaminococcus intestinavium]|uniref:NAD(P)/FAD-dependent oxidoreductase n=1 Tax=Candidatus Avacidaminococcus intestinavium TaxID=2840684 RepID=A0A9D1MPL1_9FIRM|nr:NAD(P)/FAD-dependent oxidoreductase [Candidatus Avacidaminococcus intestinavium]
MQNMFDVAIIGGGPAAIFAAYEFSLKYPTVKTVIIEEGHTIATRRCPLAEKKVNHCLRCVPCDIMRGFGGAGAFSDGKFNFTTEFGGWLNEYIPEKEVIELIDYVDELNCQHGAPGEYYSTKNCHIAKEALGHDLHLLNAKVRHLGTENNLLIMENIYQYLSNKVEIKCNTHVEKINLAEDGSFCLTLRGHEEQITSRYLIAAPGRAGAEWFTEQCKALGLTFINNQVDVGVRVEVPAQVFKHITDEVYEAKLVYRTKQYGDLVRTFCMNPNGYVVAENTDGIVTVNGHSYRDPALHSKNTNFALLVSNKFTEPFKEPLKYGKRIASFSNMLGGGVLVQRFGDLIKGRRTNEKRLAKSFTEPTLEATPGDLSLVLPKRHLDNIIEMIYALDKVAPGMSNDDTLLYGVEVKFYSARLELDGALETKIPNLFAIGDGAGITRGLSQASASGVFVARQIGERIAKDK